MMSPAQGLDQRAQHDERGGADDDREPAILKHKCYRCCAQLFNLQVNPQEVLP